MNLSLRRFHFQIVILDFWELPVSAKMILAFPTIAFSTKSEKGTISVSAKKSLETNGFNF